MSPVVLMLVTTAPISERSWDERVTPRTRATDVGRSSGLTMPALMASSRSWALYAHRSAIILCLLLHNPFDLVSYVVDSAHDVHPPALLILDDLLRDQ